VLLAKALASLAGYAMQVTVGAALSCGYVAASSDPPLWRSSRAGKRAAASPGGAVVQVLEDPRKGGVRCPATAVWSGGREQAMRARRFP
jgi:hypothetical protein